MRTLLADPALAARLGAEGRVLVHDRFGIDRMVAESLRLYQSLLDRKSSRQASAPQSGDRPVAGSPAAADET